MFHVVVTSSDGYGEADTVMKYMGSKSRFAKEILEAVLSGGRHPQQFYVEPFVGGCNVINKMSNPRIGNDSHPYLISMWKALQVGWRPPILNKLEYQDIRLSPERYAPELVGWAGFNCSYSGKWFGGFAGLTRTKIGTFRDYQAEALRNVLRQVADLDGVDFQNVHYADLAIPENSIIYCDPPYEGTTKYKDDFDHCQFWEWVRFVSRQHTTLVSEYNAPTDFECVWQTTATSSLSANGRIGGNKLSTERLFRWEGA